MSLKGLLDSWYAKAFGWILNLIERGSIPDFVVRYDGGIKAEGDVTEQVKRKQDLLKNFEQMPIAINTGDANEQHYEVPTRYFDLCLGKWKKYSSCLYKTPGDSLQKAEENMLSLYCSKAGIEDGMALLDLGCGWGSLTLFMAEAFPKSSVTGLSNSRTQREYIEAEAAQRGLKNVKVVTDDINNFEASAKYDRIMSIEMFEHMKNYKALLKTISRWLNPGGKLFVHHFCHFRYVYEFKVEREDDWMSKYFFTGGTMPSLDLLLHYQEDLVVKDLAYVNGKHYSLTLEAWLQSLLVQAMPKVWCKDVYNGEADIWFIRWRLFYLACSELFKYRGGNEWGLAHVLMEKRQD